MRTCDRRQFFELLAAGSGIIQASPTQLRNRYAASPAGRDWTRFNAVHFNYAAIGEKITLEHIKKKIRDTVDSGSKVPMFFIMQEGYALYDSKVTERYPFATDFEVLTKVATGAKASQLKLIVCWMETPAGSRTYKVHPSWRWKDAESKEGVTSFSGQSVNVRRDGDMLHLTVPIPERIQRHPAVMVSICLAHLLTA